MTPEQQFLSSLAMTTVLLVRTGYEFYGFKDGWGTVFGGLSLIYLLVTLSLAAAVR